MTIPIPKSFTRACAAGLCVALGSATAADIPRTSTGLPDLTGNYDGGSITPVERPRELGEQRFMDAGGKRRRGLRGRRTPWRLRRTVRATPTEVRP